MLGLENVQPPFSISSEAERFLRDRLQGAPPGGMEPALHGSSRMEVRDKHNRLTARYNDTHFFVGYGPPAQHDAFVYLDIVGRKVALHPKVLELLKGKRLTLRPTDPIEGIVHKTEVLIAIDERAQQT